jgi:hypothetical protein
MVVHLDQLAALRRERRERLESKHRVNRATRWEVRPITDVHSTVLGKEEIRPFVTNNLRRGQRNMTPEGRNSGARGDVHC